MPVEKALQNWKELYPKSYNKREVDPYTKTRIILMNGTEFEANWFSHQLARHTTDNDLRRDLALTRYIEKQQQLKISLLKPENESILEHTISYEQLAVDLTAELAKREMDCNVKSSYFLITKYSKAMKANKWGRIVTIGSVNQYNQQHYHYVRTLSAPTYIRFFHWSSQLKEDGTYGYRKTDYIPANFNVVISYFEGD